MSSDNESPNASTSPLQVEQVESIIRPPPPLWRSVLGNFVQLP